MSVEYPPPPDIVISGQEHAFTIALLIRQGDQIREIQRQVSGIMGALTELRVRQKNLERLCMEIRDLVAGIQPMPSQAQIEAQIGRLIRSSAKHTVSRKTRSAPQPKLDSHLEELRREEEQSNNQEL